MVVGELLVRHLRRMFVQISRREDVVVGHVPIRQHEQAGQERWVIAAVAAQQDAVGVFVAAVGFGELATIGMQLRLPIDHPHLIRVVQAVVHANDVQGAVVGAERAGRVAQPGQRIAEHHQGLHERWIVAAAALFDGLNDAFDEVDGIGMFFGVHMGNGLPHRCLFGTQHIHARRGLGEDRGRRQRNAADCPDEERQAHVAQTVG